jgi:hypothetical protein
MVKVVDGLMAIFDAVTGLKDALTSAPPNFKKAVDALDRLAPVPKTLASLLPPVAFPNLILGCTDMVLRLLGQVRGELLHLNQQLVDLVQVEETARQFGDVRLERVYECAKHNIEQEVVNLGRGMASIGSLVGMISTLASLAQLPIEIPKLTGFDGLPLDKVIEPLDVLIDSFMVLRKALPQ